MSLTHIDEDGRAAMVDVTAKADTDRSATAGAEIRLKPETLALIAEGRVAKGDVFATARIAGIMAAKKTHELIPLCHPLMLTGVEIDITAGEGALQIMATAKVRGPTGVEMEALTAASVAALTIYDMVKAVDRTAVIGEIRLLAKSGGRSGVFNQAETPDAAEGAIEAEAPAPTRVSAPGGYKRRTPLRPVRPLSRDIGHAEPVAPVAQLSRADAFRQYLRDNRMQVSSWAAEAGLPVGLIYGFLHGRVGRLPRDSEERLAKSANATVRDVFGSE